MRKEKEETYVIPTFIENEKTSKQGFSRRNISNNYIAGLFRIIKIQKPINSLINYFIF